MQDLYFTALCERFLRRLVQPNNKPPLKVAAPFGAGGTPMNCAFSAAFGATEQTPPFEKGGGRT